MVYTLFFSRLVDMETEHREAYLTRSGDLHGLAKREHPGFVDLKVFTADDGERLTVVRFQDPMSQRAWKLDRAHLSAQAAGRSDYYERYRIVVCDAVREHGWSREDGYSEGGAMPVSRRSVEGQDK